MERGGLHFKSSSGKTTEGLKKQLEEHKAEIVKYLQESRDNGFPPTSFSIISIEATLPRAGSAILTIFSGEKIILFDRKVIFVFDYKSRINIKSCLYDVFFSET